MTERETGGAIWNHGSRTFAWFFAIAGLLWFLGALGWALRVIQKVLEGRGLEFYTTWWGVPVNYIAALVVIVVIAVIVLVAPFLRWWGDREEQDFKRKYGIEDRNT